MIEPTAKQIVEAWEQDNLIMFTVLPQISDYNTTDYYMVNDQKFMGGKCIIDVDAVVIKHTVKSQIVGWRDADDVTISVDEYQERKKELNPNGLCSEDDEWNDLDAEFAFKKFERRWVHQVREDIITDERIEFDIHPAVRDVNDHIVAMAKIGGDITNTLYTYYRGSFISETVRNFFLDKGYNIVTDNKFANAKYNELVWRDGVRSSKFHDGRNGSQYLTTAIRELEQFEKAKSINGQPEELVSKQLADKKIILDALHAYYFRDEVPDAATVGSIRSDIQNILKDYNQIASKIKTQKHWTNGKNKLLELDNKLVAMARTNED